MARLFSRVPGTVRAAVLVFGALAVLGGLAGAMHAQAHPVAYSHVGRTAPSARAGHAAGAPATTRRAPTAAGVVRLDAVIHGARDSRATQPGGICQVPGIGDISGIAGLCTAGASGLTGDINNICQPSVPTPEPATGSLNALVQPTASPASRPATLYDTYGIAGQSWAAYDLQCSDMASLIGNNVAGVVFDAAKALDRVTITVYQSAAGQGILGWLTGAVDKLITSLGSAIYFPYLEPVIIIGAIWLAWQGLIRKRATRTIEGTLWMVVACAAAIWLIGRPADFTGFGRTVSDGISQTLNIAFAKLPSPHQDSCVPLQRSDPQAPAAGGFSYSSGSTLVGTNANELWTVLVCKPWLEGEFGTTSYATAKGANPTVINTYGRQLLWAQAVAVNEKPTAALIQAKQDTYVGIAAALKLHDPAVYPLFQGKQWTSRLEIAFAALFAAVIAGLLVLLIAITLIMLKLGFLLLLVAGPFFLIVGTHPGFGRVIALRWAELLVGVLLKQAAVALVLSVLLYAYSLIMGTSDAALSWVLKILMISLVTVAVFIYRKPFAHLFSAVGYGMIGAREQSAVSLARAGRTAGRNTVDAATVAVPGFAAYRAARWARRNPAQAASLAAQVATAGAAGAAGSVLAGGQPGGRVDGQAGANGAGESGEVADGAYEGGGGRARDRVRAGTGVDAGQGRTPPPLDLPPRPPGSGPSPMWGRMRSKGPPGAVAGQARQESAAPPSRSRAGGPSGSASPPAAKPAVPPARVARQRAAPEPGGRGGAAEAGPGGADQVPPGPFWLRPLRFRNGRPRQ